MITFAVNFISILYENIFFSQHANVLVSSTQAISLGGHHPSLSYLIYLILYSVALTYLSIQIIIHNLSILDDPKPKDVPISPRRDSVKKIPPVVTPLKLVNIIPEDKQYCLQNVDNLNTSRSCVTSQETTSTNRSLQPPSRKTTNEVTCKTEKVCPEYIEIKQSVTSKGEGKFSPTVSTDQTMNVPLIPWSLLHLNEKTGLDSDAVIVKGMQSTVFKAVLASTEDAQLFDMQDPDRLVVVKVITNTLLSPRSPCNKQQISKAMKKAMEEIRIILDAESKVMNKDCIIKIYGICEGQLPAQISHALKLADFTNAVGIVLRYERGGSLEQYIHTRPMPSINSSTGLREDLMKQQASLALALDSTPTAYSISTPYSSSTSLESTTALKMTHLTTPKKLQLLCDIAKGLAELHSAGIVHGDIKPANVLLSNTINPQIRLADFGLSTMNDRNDENSYGYLSRTFNFQGTPVYCAPEMLVNPYDDNVDDKIAKASRKTDMYAFAILAWEVLSGERPFHEIKNQSLLGAKVHQGCRPPLELLPLDCPQAVIDLIEACWNENWLIRKTAHECYAILQYYAEMMTSCTYDIYLTSHPDDEDFTQMIYQYLLKQGYKVYYSPIKASERMRACSSASMTSSTPTPFALTPRMRSYSNSSIVSSPVLDDLTKEQIMQCKLFIPCISPAFQSDSFDGFQLLKTAKQHHRKILPIFLKESYLKWLNQEMIYCCQLRAAHPIYYDMNTIFTLHTNTMKTSSFITNNTVSFASTSHSNIFGNLTNTLTNSNGGNDQKKRFLQTVHDSTEMKSLLTYLTNYLYKK